MTQYNYKDLNLERVSYRTINRHGLRVNSPSVDRSSTSNNPTQHYYNLPLTWIASSAGLTGHASLRGAVAPVTRSSRADRWLIS